METKTLSAAGFAVGTLALVLAVVGLLTRPEGADGGSEELATLRDEVSALDGKLAAASSAEASASARAAELSGRVAELERAVADLGEISRAAGAEEPAGQAVPAEIDEERLRALIREVAGEEIRNAVREAERPRGGPGGRGGRGMAAEGLREQLGLDEEQAEKVAALLQTMMEDTGAIWRENRGGGRDQNRELTEELRRKTDEEVGKLLTPEQMERYKAIQDEFGRRGRRRGGRRERDRPGGEPDREPAGDAPVF